MFGSVQPCGPNRGVTTVISEPNFFAEGGRSKGFEKVHSDGARAGSQDGLMTVIPVTLSVNNTFNSWRVRTFQPNFACPNHFVENDPLWWRLLEEYGRWMDEDVLINAEGAIRDSSRRGEFRSSRRSLVYNIFASSNVINCSRLSLRLSEMNRSISAGLGTNPSTSR